MVPRWLPTGSIGFVTEGVRLHALHVKNSWQEIKMTNQDVKEIVERVAAVHLWRDTYPDGPDIVTDRNIGMIFQPRHIRAAREWLELMQD